MKPIETSSAALESFARAVETPFPLPANGTALPLERIRNVAARTDAIPRKLHWVWLGSPLPSRFAENINDIAYHHPNHEATLWTSSTSWHSGHAAALKNLSPRIRIRNVDEAFNELPRPLHAAFIRESNGSLKNFAAASDIARVAVEYDGGIYMDVDAQLAMNGVRVARNLKQPPTQAFANLHAPAGFLIYPRNNQVIAAAPGHRLINKAIEKITSAYTGNTREGADDMWRVKRDYTHYAEMVSLQEKIDKLRRTKEDWAEEQADSLHDEKSRLYTLDFAKGLGYMSTYKNLPRLAITVDATGPRMWARVAPMEMHTFPKELLPDIPADTQSYTRKPFLRRDSI
jgi:hypothetical protein